MPEKILGNFLRSKRESKKLGVREMARTINISASYLSDIELGRTNPSLDTLRIISDFLELNQAERANLLSGINVNPTQPSPKKLNRAAGRAGAARKEAVSK